MGKLFGTDGIRGEANRYPMDAGVAFSVGQAVTYLFKNTRHRTRVVIGKDTRISGYMLESALESGIASMGGLAYLLGVMPTPGIAFIARNMRADAGIVISASHNPYQDNGIKIFSGEGFKLSDEQEETIERLLLNNELADKLPSAADMGRAYRMEDAPGRYIVFVKSTFPRHLSMEGMKIVMDTGNGATFRVAPAVFEELGGDVEIIHNTLCRGCCHQQCRRGVFGKHVAELGRCSLMPGLPLYKTITLSHSPTPAENPNPSSYFGS